MRSVPHNALIAAGQASPSSARALSSIVAALLALTLALGSCATVQQDLVARSAADSDFVRLAELADRDARLRADVAGADSASDKAALAQSLAQALSEARELRAAAPLDADYRARLAAITGDLTLLSGDRAGASSYLAAAQSARGDDEWVYLLRERLADEKSREAILVEGAGKANANLLLTAELGALRFRQGRYREAVSALDEVLTSLDEAERALYQPIRDKALTLAGTEGAGKDLADYVGSDRLSLLGLVTITQRGTNLLDYLTGAKSWAPTVLFARLDGAGYLGPGPNAPEDPATRARAALLLWNFVAVRENKPGLLHAYDTRYPAGSNGPVPDAAPGSWYFDAALGCAEREILDLADGRLFEPDLVLTGAQALAAARRAEQ